jgi:hypothetical protein
MNNQLRENESRANPISRLEYCRVTDNLFHPGKDFVKRGKKTVRQRLFNQYCSNMKKPPSGG